MYRRNTLVELSRIEKEKLRNEVVRFGSMKMGCYRYSLGESTLRKLCREAGALIKVGRRSVIDFEVLDDYVRQLKKK